MSSPNALAPVFWGYDAPDTAPTPLRVLFPTLDGSPQHARPLEIDHHHPLVVLCHGNSTGDPEPYLHWAEDVVAIQLARAGYVVAVPHLPGIASGSSAPLPGRRDADVVRSVIAWVRSAWSHAGVVAPEPSTAILGHSWGALLSWGLAADGGFQAFGSLSGEWADWFTTIRDLLPSITCPSLYTWSTSDVAPLPDNRWAELVHTPRHKAVLDWMTHFDYLPPGTTPLPPGARAAPALPVHGGRSGRDVPGQVPAAGGGGEPTVEGPRHPCPTRPAPHGGAGVLGRGLPEGVRYGRWRPFAVPGRALLRDR